MYSLYSKEQKEDKLSFKQKDNISLYGCNVGFIPRLLRERLSRETFIANARGAVKWHIPVAEMLATIGYKDSAIIIDIKPTAKNDILLSELLDVWGYSSSGWTPILMRQNIILVDVSLSDYDKSDFLIESSQKENIVYSLLYLQGTVFDRELSGKWTCPGPSSTNSVLLWPETLNYFWDCVQNAPKK